MFTVVQVSSVDSKVSKVEILRGLITEKLTTAAQEIFAVVERTVAGYEEEVAELKQEVERQQRQLEVVLQPQVLLCRIDDHGLLPVCEPGKEEADGGGHAAQTFSLEVDENEDEDDKVKVEPAQPAGLDQDFLHEQENQMAARTTEGTGSGKCSTPDTNNEGRTESKTHSFSSNTKRKCSVRRTCRLSPANSVPDSEGESNGKNLDDRDDDWRPAEGHEAQKKNQTKLNGKKQPKRQSSLKLSVCFLDDSQTDVLSDNDCTVQELLCPPGLQEADFMNLLRSTFPQLAADKPFDIFAPDRKRRLQLLNLETLTPEAICWNRAGKSTLYIRLKTGEDPKTSEQLHVLQKQEDTTTYSPSKSTVTSNNTRQHISGTVQNKQENTAQVLCDSATSQVMEMEGDDDNEEAGISKPRSDVQASCSANSVEPDVTEDEEQERKVKVNTKAKRGRKWIKSSPQVLTENSDSVVSCKVCGFLYKSRNFVIRHSWTHVDDPKTFCGVCGEHSESAEELRSHLQGHLKTHICNICGKAFITRNDFREHTAGHTGQKPHKCDICGKGFFFKGKLTAHQKDHLVGKHKCHVCQKAFYSQAEVKRHSREHTEKLYRCSVCGKFLRKLSSLSQHMLLHSDEKRHGCDVCGKHFRLRQNLIGHKKIHTVRERPYLCDICCKSFCSTDRLNAHLKTHKKKPHTCSECGRAYESEVNLLSHMKIHFEERPYSCSVCGRTYKYKNNFTDHMILHSDEKRFACGICGKPCARQTHLTIHMRSHTGERPYKCTLCHKAFAQNYYLKMHMKNHRKEENLPSDGLMS
ncbi:zinc finger protein 37-like [Channa argus]|nr:hypothetical protein Q8A73_012594 [Channa argus]